MPTAVKPLVSIVTPVYNAERFLKDTIKSVQSQTYDNWELILVDDVSSDKSIEIIKEAQKSDERIKLIELKENSGAAPARNAGTKAAKGRYLAFLDADDIWLPKKLMRQLNLAQSTETPFIFSGYEFGDEQAVPNGTKVVVPTEVSYEDFLANNIIWTTTVLLDLKRIKREHIFMPDRSYGEDALTWLCLLKNYGVAKSITEPLAIYRRTAGSLSASKREVVIKKFQLYWSISDMNALKRLYYYVLSMGNALLKRV